MHFKMFHGSPAIIIDYPPLDGSGPSDSLDFLQLPMPLSHS
jgi:hypothetical protein